MRALFTTILTIFFFSTVFGTLQRPDILIDIDDGKEYVSPYVYPLERYFQKYPEKRPKRGKILPNGYMEIEVLSSNLWRGYVATFVIKQNQLYLKDIEIEVRDTIKKIDTNFKSVLNEIFPNQQLIKTDWMTGLLVLSKTMMMNDPRIIVEIDSGNVKKKIQLEYEKYREFEKKQVEAFMKTHEYETFKANLKKEGYDDEAIESILRGCIIEYSSKILVEEEEILIEEEEILVEEEENKETANNWSGTIFICIILFILLTISAIRIIKKFLS